MSAINKLFSDDIKVVNIGLESFYQELKDQEVEAIHVKWRPRAGGNKKMMALLDRLKSNK